MIAALVTVQLAAGLGFYAVMAHVVAHLREDAGMLAGTIALVLGARLLAQYALYLPMGPLTDRLGAARSGVVACVLRAVGFGLLGVVDGAAGLAGAATLLGVGGALFQPATRSLLAVLRPERRARGFGASLIAGQIAAVAGPPVGLLVLSNGRFGGFGALAAVAATAWVVAALMFALLHRTTRPARTASRAARAGSGAPEPAGVRRSVAAVLRDRSYLRFTWLAAPTTLLPTQTLTVVPLKGFDADVRTLYFCVLAAVAAAVQPWCAAHAGRGWVLKASLALSGLAYLLLIPLNDHGAGSVAALMVVAVLHGLSYGLLEPAIFQSILRHASASQVGAYYGVMAFVSGMVAFFGGLVVGRLFDSGPAGVATALAGLGALGLATAVIPSFVRDTRPDPAPRPVREKAGAPR